MKIKSVEGKNDERISHTRNRLAEVGALCAHDLRVEVRGEQVRKSHSQNQKEKSSASRINAKQPESP